MYFTFLLQILFLILLEIQCTCRRIKRIPKKVDFAQRCITSYDRVNDLCKNMSESGLPTSVHRPINVHDKKLISQSGIGLYNAVRLGCFRSRTIYFCSFLCSESPYCGLFLTLFKPDDSVIFFYISYLEVCACLSMKFSELPCIFHHSYLS